MPSEHPRNVVVTGANRGLGLEFVRRYLARGDRVVAAVRHPDKATELKALANEGAPGQLTAIPLDVQDVASVLALRELLPFDSVDILVNNAGVGGSREQRFEDVVFDALEATLQVNSIGPLRVTRALWDRLADSAKLLFVSSLMGSIADNGSGGRYAYRMSKTALNMAVRCSAWSVRSAASRRSRSTRAGCGRAWGVNPRRSRSRNRWRRWSTPSTARLRATAAASSIAPASRCPGDVV